MHEIQMHDNLYQLANQRALDLGFKGVDEYVADIVRCDLAETENFDHLFTSERMAHIEKSRRQVDAGQVHTSEEVWAYLERKRDK